MKKIIPIFLVLGICVAMLLSCGQSATQVLDNLKEQDYVTTKWTQEQIDEKLVTLLSDDYNISAVYSAVDPEENEVTVIQLDTLSQAKALVEKLEQLQSEGVISEDSQIVAEGRLVIVGSEDSVNDALNN